MLKNVSAMKFIVVKYPNFTKLQLINPECIKWTKFQNLKSMDYYSG